MKVLAIEDEAAVADVLRSELGFEGFDVTVYNTGENLLQNLEEIKPDVLLLDQMLPGKKGWELVREIREDKKFSELPIIMVTGMAGEDDQIRALDRGADDYITKPFRVRQLAARIRAVHRRTSGAFKQEQERLENGDLVVELDAHRVWLSENEINLTVTEFNILGELLRNVGKVVSREQLRETALNNLNVTDRTIDVHMAALRKKLDHRGDSIQTVRGVGYRFAGQSNPDTQA